MTIIITDKIAIGVDAVTSFPLLYEELETQLLLVVPGLEDLRNKVKRLPQCRQFICYSTLVYQSSILLNDDGLRPRW